MKKRVESYRFARVTKWSKTLAKLRCSCSAAGLRCLSAEQIAKTPYT